MASERAESQIDVINMAGLLMHEREDTLEASIRNTLNPRFLVTIAPTPPSSIFEDPEISIRRAIEQIQAEIDKLSQDTPKNIVLVGRSYGGFMALLAACRMRLETFLKLVLIEAPLHPDINVEPPPLMPPLRLLCGKHYAQRPDFAREAVAALKTQGTDRIVTIANREDRVVPPKSMGLPGNFQTFDFESDDLSPLEGINPSQGSHIVIPAHLRGDPTGISKILPPEYTDHLYWSAEKMAFVTRILQATLPHKLLIAQAA